MIIPIILTSFGFIAVGLLISLLSLKFQGRELLGNVMSLPLYLPGLFLGLRVTLDLTYGSGFGEVWHFFVYLVAFDLLTFGIAYYVFDTSLAE